LLAARWEPLDSLLDHSCPVRFGLFSDAFSDILNDRGRPMSWADNRVVPGGLRCGCWVRDGHVFVCLSAMVAAAPEETVRFFVCFTADRFVSLMIEERVESEVRVSKIGRDVTTFSGLLDRARVTVVKSGSVTENRLHQRSAYFASCAHHETRLIVTFLAFITSYGVHHKTRSSTCHPTSWGT
jgi:hypothetical protein